MRAATQQNCRRQPEQRGYPPRTSKTHLKAVPDLLCSAVTTPKPSSAQQFRLTAALLCLLCFFSPPFSVLTSNIAVQGRSCARCVVPAQRDATCKGIYSRIQRHSAAPRGLQNTPCCFKGEFLMLIPTPRFVSTFLEAFEREKRG